MAEIDVEVRKPSLGSQPGLPDHISYGAVARVRRLDLAAEARSVVVGIGTEATRIPGLAAGIYEVRVHLPSGLVLAQQVEIEARGTRHIVFDADGSPNDALAWQHLTGLVQSRPDFLEDSSDLVSRGLSPGRRIVPTAGARDSHEVLFSARIPDGEAYLPAPKVMVVQRPAEAQMTDDADGIAETWRLLARGVRGEVGPAAMVGGKAKRTKRPVDEARSHGSWRFGFTPSVEAGIRPARRFAFVQVGEARELVSLPLPWQIDDDRRPERREVDLLVDRTPSGRATHSTAAVGDEDYSGLLGYLGTGMLSLAGEMLRVGQSDKGAAIDRLCRKSNSPVGACAAAYVLMAATAIERSGPKPAWQRWIWDLASDADYHWVPDAAIIGARLRLLRARDRAEARQAVPLLHRALRHGLPFYAMGMAWLLDAMAFCRDDPVIARAYDDVDLVGRYLDISQPFLVLQLDRTGK